MNFSFKNVLHFFFWIVYIDRPVPVPIPKPYPVQTEKLVPGEYGLYINCDYVNIFSNN